ncbi:DUF2207 domain-containing protein, partial [Enterococcus faecalis]|nr:DUF2207 domain-containing protein [Enterococcus faecalis]
DRVAQATSVDLIDRGNLTIEENDQEPLLAYQSDEGLTSAERVFLEMAFSEQNVLAMDQLFMTLSADQHVLKTRKKKQQKAIRASGRNLINNYQEAFNSLKKAVEDERHLLNLPDYYRDYSPYAKITTFSIGLPTLLVSLAVLVFYLLLLIQFSTHSWFILILFALTLLAFVGIASAKSALNRNGLLTEAGLEQYQLWESFKNMLRDIGKFDKTE